MGWQIASAAAESVSRGMARGLFTQDQACKLGRGGGQGITSLPIALRPSEQAGRTVCKPVLSGIRRRCRLPKRHWKAPDSALFAFPRLLALLEAPLFFGALLLRV